MNTDCRGNELSVDRHLEQNSPEAGGRFTLLIMSSAAFACCVMLTCLGQWLIRTNLSAEAVSGAAARTSTWQSGILITLPMLVLLYLERRSSIRWLRDLWSLSRDLLGPLVAKVTIAELVIVAVFAGVGEELLFRGFLHNWLITHHLLLALILPNVLFGLLHWISRGYAICTFCVGFYFSCLLHFLDSVNLTALMIAHSLYDLIALLLLLREVVQQKQLAGTQAVIRNDQTSST